MCTHITYRGLCNPTLYQVQFCFNNLFVVRVRVFFWSDIRNFHHVSSVPHFVMHSSWHVTLFPFLTGFCVKLWQPFVHASLIQHHNMRWGIFSHALTLTVPNRQKHICVFCHLVHGGWTPYSFCVQHQLTSMMGGLYRLVLPQVPEPVHYHSCVKRCTCNLSSL